MKRILIFSTYTIDDAKHGGQRRVRAIFDALTTNGFEVYHVAISARQYRTLPPRHYILEDSEVLDKSDPLNCLISDYYIATPERWPIKARDSLKKIIERISPDCIQFDQPWLYPIVNEILKDNSAIPFFYSSQNIEADLKKKILLSSGLNAELVKSITAKISDIENTLAMCSSHTFAVSDNDCEYFQQIGVKNVTLVRNCSDLVRYFDVPPKHQPYKYVCFVGSGHPPNATGFKKMIGSFLAFLSPKTKIHILGEVAYSLMADDDFKSYEKFNSRRLEMFPRLTDIELAAHLFGSSGVILPITEGGGSNLKTAEALLTGKPIVATRVAMRGFEDFITQAGVHVCDDPCDFKKKVVYLLNSDADYFERPEKSKQMLFWDFQMRPLVEIYKELFADGLSSQ